MSSERIEAFYRDATAADVARVMAGEQVEARFRDRARDEWKCRGLIGWSRGSESDSFVWASDGLVHYRHCQVYDPPQYWLDKPEPGEGYRLLNKFPAEDLQPGDEVWLERKEWVPSYGAATCDAQQADAWYRRRIEQPKPEPKHYVLQVGDTISVPSGRQAIVTEHGIEVQ